MTAVFLNGRFVEVAQAAVPAFDAGLQHGVGLFETMIGGVGTESSDEPWVFRLEEHLERLGGSARDLGLSDSLRLPALAEAVLETVRRAGLERSRVRLTITGGDLNILARAREPETAGESRQVQPTILIVAQAATRYPREMFERGVAVTIADYKANPLDPFAGHKTINYWPRLRELQIAAGKRAAEALVFQVSNFLCGGCVSNALLAKDGRLVTPIARGEEGTAPTPVPANAGEQPQRGVAIPSPVLPGITREWVCQWANENRLPLVRKMVTVDEILDADEVLLTNSSWGVLPVVKVESQAIGDAVVGEVGRKLVRAWDTQVRGDGESL